MENRFKFRAWDKQTEKIIYNDLFCYDSTLSCYINLDGEIREEGNGLQRYDFILMQNTGLKDKNGKEIYEGDIVKYKTNYYGNYKEHITEIKWIDDLEHDGFGEPLAMGYIFRGYDIEIIGNIYENKDLLTN